MEDNNYNEKAAEQMANYVNSSHLDVEKFTSHMKLQHPTLQQLFTKVAIGWIWEMADSQSEDLRISASIEVCKKIKEKYEEEYKTLYKPVLPLI